VRRLAAVHLVGRCGGAWHASLIAVHDRADRRIPCDVDLASEYRYREPIVSNRHLVVPGVAVGETADTIAALKESEQRGAKSAGDLQRARGHDRAGGGLGTLHARRRDRRRLDEVLRAQIGGAVPARAEARDPARHALARTTCAATARSCAGLPRLVRSRRWACGRTPRTIARRHQHARDFLYLGKGYGFPIALEGALS